ncbi:restriction endonuclease subunit S [Heyndrickxia faecalis]|uniref:Restriction endonuclease subunit S n=1 Tax=Heyndrickxia faecalis TaxID=2824910 RepID=A0AAU7WHW7_9BACI
MMEQKNLVPKRRFKEFQNTSAWEQRKLKDFGKATGGTSIESEFVDGGKYKVISIGSYSEQSVYTDQNIRAGLTDKTKNRILNKDDLTMILNDKTASGNIIGRVLLIDSNDSYVYNQRTERIEPDHEKYNSQFLYQLLNAPMIRSRIIKQAQGNTQIYVNWSAISELDYLVPNLDEQREIGAFFSNFDHLIALHQRKLEKMKTLKSAYLSEMFPAEGERMPKRRFAGFTQAWEQRKLGEVVKTHQFRSYLAEPNAEGDFEVIQQGDRPVAGYTNGTPFENYRDVTLFGDHTVSLYKPTKPFFIATDGVKILSADGLEGDFLFSLLERYKPEPQGYKRHFTILKNQGAWITKNVEEQVKIGTFFKNLDHLITLHQRKLEKLQSIKKAYLNEMFV